MRRICDYGEALAVLYDSDVLPPPERPAVVLRWGLPAQDKQPCQYQRAIPVRPSTRPTSSGADASMAAPDRPLDESAQRRTHNRGVQYHDRMDWGALFAGLAVAWDVAQQWQLNGLAWRERNDHVGIRAVWYPDGRSIEFINDGDVGILDAKFLDEEWERLRQLPSYRGAVVPAHDSWRVDLPDGVAFEDVPLFIHVRWREHRRLPWRRYRYHYMSVHPDRSLLDGEAMRRAEGWRQSKAGASGASFASPYGRRGAYPPIPSAGR